MKQKIKLWHSFSAKDVLKILSSSPRGLTSGEADLRLEKYGKNAFEHSRKFWFLKLLLRQVRSPLVFILLIAGLVTLFLGAYTDSAVIFIAVFINTIIGIVQEGKASQAFEKLRDSQKKYTTVIRDGQKLVTRAENIVPGDVLVLSAGDQVTADARIIESKGLEINEAILTGEWIPSAKNTRKVGKEIALSDRTNMVWMSTLVTEGWATAVVVGTSFNTEVGKIAEMIGEAKTPLTPFQLNVKKIAKLLSLIILGSIVLIFGEGILRGEAVSQMLFTSVAIAVAAIPEGLPVAVSVVLAIGMEKILARGGLVKKLNAAETLGSIDVILTDKTGTLTQAIMRVSDIITLGSLPDDREQVLKMGILASDGFIENPDDKLANWIVRGRPIEQALLLAGIESGLYPHKLLKEQERIDFLPFDSERRFAASLHKVGKNTKRSFISGAPEYILDLANDFYKNGKTEKLTKKDRETLIGALEKQASYGARVIGVAYKDVNFEEFLRKEDEAVFEKCVFGGFVVFHDPLRPDAIKAIRKSALAGIRTVMVTGDHKKTARKIGKETKIWKGERIIIGEEVEKMNDQRLKEIVQKTSIFARVLPHQKSRIVKAWQSLGKTVAMTGDGINDAPALRSAEVGVALNSGTEVAKESAEIVLLNNSFSVIISAIEEGRRILWNLRKIVVYLLSTGFSEIILIGSSLAIGLPLPILPAQILWTNLVEEGFLNFAFAFEPREKGVMKSSPKSFSAKKLFTNESKKLIILLSIFTSGLLVLLFLLYHFIFKHDIGYTRTVIFGALSVDSIFHVFSLKNFKKPIWKINIFSNTYLIVAVLISFSFLAGALFIPQLRYLLSLEKLAKIDILVICFIGILNLVLIELIKRFLMNKKTDK